jgi:hypothetical protein
MDRNRIRRWCSLALAVQLAIFVFVVLGTHGLIVPLHGAGTTDFVSFYAAGHLANGPDPVLVYDRAAHHAAEQAATASNTPYVFFFYPPVFLLLCGPLAHLPYLVAFLLLEGMTGTALLLVLAATLRRSDNFWLLPVLSFSPLFWAIGMGQNSCLSAALLGGGCLLLERRRDFTAGLVFSLLLFKPHLGLLLPVALLASKRWRAVFGAALGVCALVSLSILCFGFASWLAFSSALLRASGEFARQQVVPFAMLASTYGSARLIGFAQMPATLLEFAVDLFVATCIWRHWRRCSPQQYEVGFGMLVSGTLMVMPVVLFYDTTMLLVSAAWTVRAASRGISVHVGWLVAAWLFGLVGYSTSRAIHLPLPMLSVACCFLATLNHRPRAASFMIS